MAGKIKDLTGLQFGDLTVLRFDHIENKHAYWSCQCICGNLCIKLGSDLTSKRTRSCGCFKKNTLKQQTNKNRLAQGQANLNVLYNVYHKKAKNRNYVFSLTLDQFKVLTQQNCYYCGIEPNQRKDVSSYGEYTYNGIDRVDNTKGYIIDNCVACCGTCNLAKRSMSKKQFLDWIKRVYDHTFTKLSEKTPAMVTDELFTTLMKLWLAQEDVMNAEPNTDKALNAAKKAQQLNARRNKLMRTLDQLLGFEEDTLTEKTYTEGTIE